MLLCYFFYWIDVIVVLITGIYLFSRIQLWLFFASVVWFGKSAKISSDGLTVYSKQKGIIDFYSKVIKLRNSNIEEFYNQIKKYKPDMLS